MTVSSWLTWPLCTIGMKPAPFDPFPRNPVDLRVLVQDQQASGARSRMSASLTHRLETRARWLGYHREATASAMTRKDPDLSLTPGSARPARGLFLSLVASALLLAACSSGGTASSSAPAAADCAKPDANGVVQLSAESIAFSNSCIDVPAGTAFKIEFNNKDSVPHDVAIFTDSSKGTSLFTGDIIDGGKSVTYDVPALDAGEYYFECTVHPNMNGKVTVA
jgi:plastocyanin